MPHRRREFLNWAIGGAAACSLRVSHLKADDKSPVPLKRALGITTSSLSGHLAAQPAAGKFTLLELPRILRDELDMRVIDLNTSALASYQPEYLDRVRRAVEDAGCVITNLKLNQPGLDMNSAEEPTRRRALDEYRRSIDAAARLGARWARPLPLKERPDMQIHVASYRELADYAAERRVQMLVENYGWMQGDPDSVVKLVRAVDRNLAACPDTGNWDSEELRQAGLARTFPIAVTCDFKARQLGPEGQHAAYDLKRCFTIGWQAGFQGPWCLEHANPDRAALFRELALLRDLLRRWMAEAT
jgi:hypothetical protein